MMQTSPIDQVTGNRLVVEESTEIPIPISEVYRRWTDLPHFPEFMSNVHEVRPIGGDRYHWVARILGTKQEWDVEITDREPLRRIAWRSITGPYNAGTVSFSELPNNKTEVRTRLEYTPPGGVMGQKLDKMAHATRREVKQDLQNFKRMATGERTFTGEPQTPEGFGRIMGLLGIPIAAGVAAGIGAWFFEPNLRRTRTMRVRAPMRQYMYPVEPAANTVSWVWTSLTGGALLASAILRAQGRRNDSLFVGQWVPTMLQFGLLSRLIGRRRMPVHPVANAASYALAGASLATIVTSGVTHATGKRSDGLFIGQWAPTFLGLSLLMRLLNRW
jgi:uncharacterized membrane protein